MPTFNPMLTLLATDRPSDPVTKGVIEKANQNTDRRFWYAGVVAKTATYTVVATDTIIFTDTSAGAFTINLPAAATVAGMMVTFKQIGTGTNVCTIDPDGSELIDFASTNTSLNAQGDAITIMSDGSQWLILSIYP